MTKPIATEFDLHDEADDLLQYFEARGFGGCDACTVMGMTITCLISSKDTAEAFMAVMRKAFATKWELTQ